MKLQQLTISPLGDSAIILIFDDKINESLNRKVLDVFYSLKKIELPFVKDIVPAYSSITISYDLLIMKNTNPANKGFAEIIEFFKKEIEKILEEDSETSFQSLRKIKIPVCYSEKFGLDLKHLSQSKNLAVEEIIYLHTSKTYRVYMIGFLPGFPYMGNVNEKIAVPRKVQPRTKVDAGSIGIAGIQTGIYPFDSPGGWQIIGKTPLQLFNKENDDPVRLLPGDEIEFFSITEDEFKNY